MKKTVILILFILPIFLLITIAFAGKILSLYQTIPVEKIQFVDALNTPYEMDDTFELNIGDKKNTTIRIFPDLASDKEVTYTSSNEEICTVDQNGAILGVSYGSTQVIVTTHDGNKQAFLTVIVTADKVQGVSLPFSELTMSLGDTFTLKPTVELPYAVNKNVLFSSDNEFIVKIDAKGKMEAKGPGTAKITVVTVDGGFSASCQVTVVMGTPALAFDFTGADFITVLSSGVHVTTQEQIDLKDYVVFNPELVKEEDIIFRIKSNSSICTLEDGVLTLLKKGPVTVEIYVGDKDNPTYQKEVIITLPLQ